MAAQTCGNALAFSANGANRPIHQDRQILRADDLALEQTTQDAMLARARRYLHGWGIVSGLAVDLVSDATSNDPPIVQVGPGYAVTPLGNEIFLPQAVTLSDALTLAWKACGPDACECSLSDTADTASVTGATAAAPTRDLSSVRAVAASDNATTVQCWLIARPGSRDASPRAGVPQGCEHPASQLLPSRRCGGVEFAVTCSLPDSHQLPSTSCSDVRDYICMNPVEAPVLPWQGLAETDQDFVVLASLTMVSVPQAASLSHYGRRSLLPVELMQRFLASCLCPLLGESPTTPTDPDTGGTLDVYVVEPTTGFKRAMTGAEADKLVKAYPQLLRSLTLGLQFDLTPLINAGIDTLGLLLTTPAATIAKLVGTNESLVIEAKNSLSTTYKVGFTFTL